VNDGAFSLWGLLILAGCIALLWSRGYRLRRAWKRSVEALEAGDTVAAEVALRSCVKQSPSWVPARRLLARTLVALRRFDEAEDHLRLVAQFEPRNAEGHLELAMFLANCPPVRADEAVASLTTAVEFAPRLREEIDRRPEFAVLREHPQFRAIAAASGVGAPVDE